uniref:Transposase n=1 Tax=Heterorhabditis bacteriophora TaxID=37862 RepID=A0A1I7WDZ7_HETBA
MQAMNTSGFSKDEYSAIIVLPDYQQHVSIIIANCYFIYTHLHLVSELLVFRKILDYIIIRKYMRRIELPWEIDSNLLQYFNKTIVIYNNNFDLARVNRFLEMNGIVPTSYSTAD